MTAGRIQIRFSWCCMRGEDACKLSLRELRIIPRRSVESKLTCDVRVLEDEQRGEPGVEVSER
jgi:hypothetical protein